MWAELDKRGALDDTLVVFVTDHGEQFAERGGFYHGVWLGSEENRSTAAFWAKNLDAGVWRGSPSTRTSRRRCRRCSGLVPPVQISGTVAGTGAADRVVIALQPRDDDHRRVAHPPARVRLGRQQVAVRARTDPEGLINVYDSADPEVQALWMELDPAIDALIDQFPWIGEPPSRVLDLRAGRWSPRIGYERSKRPCTAPFSERSSWRSLGCSSCGPAGSAASRPTPALRATSRRAARRAAGDRRAAPWRRATTNPKRMPRSLGAQRR